MRILKTLALSAILAGCAPMTPLPATPGPVEGAGIVFAERSGFGTVPSYALTVYPNEFYELDLGQFTKAPGTVETGTLPPGTFMTAQAALSDADFLTLPTDITPGNSVDCPPPVPTDLPTIEVSEITGAGTRSVVYYRGCLQSPDAGRVNALADDLRSAFGLPALVRP